MPFWHCYTAKLKNKSTWANASDGLSLSPPSGSGLLHCLRPPRFCAMLRQNLSTGMQQPRARRGCHTAKREQTQPCVATQAGQAQILQKPLEGLSLAPVHWLNTLNSSHTGSMMKEVPDRSYRMLPCLVKADSWPQTPPFFLATLLSSACTEGVLASMRSDSGPGRPYEVG